jgi:hypothetical protein
MLHQFGTANCPRCDTHLVHEYDLANDWVLPNEMVGTDQRMICPDCGFSKPVTYRVDRQLSPDEEASELRHTA